MKKIRYHINGTKLDFATQKALAAYLGVTVSAITSAEKRWCVQKNKKSFWIKNQRVKRLPPIEYIEKGAANEI